MRKIIVFTGIILIFGISLCYAQGEEEITITTYYPSPYGVYRESRSQRMAIGDNWINSGTYPWDDDGGDPEGDEIRQDADLVIEGNVGVRMKNPLATLHLYGTGVAWGEGSRIYFGDNYNLPWWENVFVEEYGGTDSDALRLHGRTGVYLCSGGTPTDRMFISGNGNVGIGTTSPGGGTGSSILSLANTSAVPTAVAGVTHLYSSAGEGYWMDAAGNFTIQTPHDPITGEWIFYSKNIKTGRVVRVDMEKMVKAIEKLTGEKFMVEKWEAVN